MSAQSFFKGNIHTHTTESDGHAGPSQVAAWYRSHGYRFLAITDHDKLTPPPSGAARPDFILIPGVELTGAAAGKTPVHVNALCGKSALTGIFAEKTPGELVSLQVAKAKADGAIALVNHPNYEWALDAEELAKTDGFELLEIASGHPLVHDAGDGDHASEEELWDSYLTGKHRVFGAAVDDAHHYSAKKGHELVSIEGQGDAGIIAAPGQAWIQAWAPELTAPAICEAIRQGHFYSARGPDMKLNALVVTPRTLEVSVDGWQPSTDHVDFIGAGGQLLERSFANPARYVLKGGEGYVRAHVFRAPAPGGVRREAWTQAYYVKYE